MNSISNPLSPKSSMGTEPSDEQWYDIASSHASRNWNDDEYLDLIKSVGRAVLALAAHPQAEPVAWLAENQDGSFDAYKEVHALIDECRQGFPVYRATHPAPQAEPTDAMIAAFNAVYNVLDLSDVQTIIRAVLALAAPAVPVPSGTVCGTCDGSGVVDGKDCPACKPSHVIALAATCSAEIGCYEGKVCWVKFHSQASLEAFATGVVMSATVKCHKPPASQSARFSCHLERDFGKAPCDRDCGKLRCMYPSEVAAQSASPFTDKPNPYSIGEGPSDRAAQSADAVDAKRYRWLRGHWLKLVAVTGRESIDMRAGDEASIDDEEDGCRLDEAIDAALQSAAHPEGDQREPGAPEFTA